jgi:preprotein translocase subunit YajC
LRLASAFQAVPPRPATPGPAQGAPQTGQPSSGQEGVGPPASEEGSGGFGLLFPILLLLPLILVLLWSSRSQQKRQQAAIAALKKGDRVVTQSGIVGKLLEIGDRYAKLEIAPGVKVEVLRSGLVGKDTGDAKVEVKR